MLLEKTEYNERIWYKIEHLGKVFETTNYKEDISDELCQQIRDNFYLITPLEKVHKQMKNLYYKKGKEDSYVYDYFFYKLAAKCILKGHKWSIDEFLQSNDLLKYAMAKVINFPKVYPPTEDLVGIIKNIRTVFRISPSGSAAKLSNFHYSIIKELLENYSQEGKTLNYYDFSCGWGTRMSAAINQNINYFGTDPNEELIDTLYKTYNEYKKVTETTSKVDIKAQGSEIFVPEWENIIDLAFSSPPYFDLEEYSGINQSTKLYPKYEDWLESYWRITVRNIKKYLQKDGHFIYNVKNLKEYNLENDMKKISEEEGFVFIGDSLVDNINRSSLRDNGKTNEEKMFIFKHKY